MPPVDDEEERRRFSRIPFGTQVRISDPRGIWQATLVDVSLKGALVDVPADWAGGIGDPVRLQIRLGEGSLSITMETRVAHLHGRRAGLACTRTDLESFTTLRRLMELNLGDEERLLREFEELG
jgi:hypothetical protein